MEMKYAHHWESRFRGPEMPRECWLTYSGTKSIRIDRHKVQNSCRYFELLLNSTFVEGRQSVINLEVKNLVSFEAFKIIITYANENRFIADPDLLNEHIQAIQLCIIWGYDEFMKVIEAHLISQLSFRTIIAIQGLAKRHKVFLCELERCCEEFDDLSRTSIDFPLMWPTCPIEGHRRHFAGYCAHKKRPEQEAEDLCNYIEQLSVDPPMSDEERHELALFRDQKIRECRGTTRKWSAPVYKNINEQSEVSVARYINALH